MEPELRGILEQVIDRRLSNEALESSLHVYQRYMEKDLIDSIESAIFGDIFSAIMSLFVQFYKSINISITMEAQNSFITMIDNKGLQIRSRINEFVNR
jgi:hypothetical protein